MTLQQFVIREEAERIWRIGDEPIPSETRYIEIEGNRIAYFVSTGKHSSGVVVPGIVKSPEYNHPKGYKVIDVEIISKGSALETAVRENLEKYGYVNFWGEEDLDNAPLP